MTSPWENANPFVHILTQADGGQKVAETIENLYV